MNATIPEDATHTNTNGRDGNGRFTKGNKGGPGNPFARQVGQLRQALIQCLTVDEMTAICQKLIERAKEGDVQAAKLLFRYALGKPPETVDPDRLDVAELEEHRGASSLFDDVLKSAFVPDTETLLGLVRNNRPEMAQDYTAQLNERRMQREEDERVERERQARSTDRSPFYVPPEDVHKLHEMIEFPKRHAEEEKRKAEKAERKAAKKRRAEKSRKMQARPSANGATATVNGTHRPSTNGKTVNQNGTHRQQTGLNGKHGPQTGQRRVTV